MGTPYLRACHQYQNPAETGRFERRFSRGPYLRVLKGGLGTYDFGRTGLYVWLLKFTVRKISKYQIQLP